MSMVRSNGIVARSFLAAVLTSISVIGFACKASSEAGDSAPTAPVTPRPTVAPKPTPTAIVLSVPTLPTALPKTIGGDGQEHVRPEVTVTDGRITIDPAGVHDTEAYFDATNLDSQAHHIAAVKWDGDPAALPVDPATGQVAGLQPEGEADLPPDGVRQFEIEGEVAGNKVSGYGKFVLYCTLPGHYARGEYTTFTLDPPS